MVEAEAHKYLTEPPKLTLLIAPKREHHKRRKLSALLHPATVEG